MVVGPADAAKRYGLCACRSEELPLGLDATTWERDARAIGRCHALGDAATAVEAQPEPRTRDMDAQPRDGPGGAQARSDVVRAQCVRRGESNAHQRDRWTWPSKTAAVERTAAAAAVAVAAAAAAASDAAAASAASAVTSEKGASAVTLAGRSRVG